jgi:prepilin-type N-terminal cleavage/methylation domain-containing protein
MMTKNRLRDLNRNQRGFTLIELVVAIAITAIISSAVGTVVYQVVKINSTSTNHQIAISQIQNAVNSISRDAEQVQQLSPLTTQNITSSAITAVSNQISFNFTQVSPNSLKLWWVDWSGTEHLILYKVDANHKLIREVYNDLQHHTLVSSSQIATNVSAASGNWNTSTKTLNIQITVTVGTVNAATEIRTFQIIPRPAQ